MKPNSALLGAFFVLATAASVCAAVSVTPATGGSAISADFATSPGWATLGEIRIAEQNGNGGRADFGVGTDVTLVLKAPVGFEFNVLAVPSITFTTGRDISAASIALSDSGTITITVTVDAVAKNDSLRIAAGLQVRPTAGTPLASGSIYRGGGTMVLNGLAAGASFANLTEVVGVATQLKFTTDPAGARVGVPFDVQPVIRTQDQFGNNSTTGLPPYLELVTTLDPGNGTLYGITTHDVGTAGGNGVVSHTDLWVDTAGYKELVARAAGLSDARSGGFIVDKGTQTLNFSPIGQKTYGDPSFTVAATASSGLLVTNYSIFSGPGAILGDSVTITGAGDITILAVQEGDDNWNLAQTSVTVRVSKATSTISWNNPADIVYGTALGTTQLNATASVPGTLDYTPAAGTVLEGGVQTLSVTFMPDDSANYSNAVASVLINVLKADQTITFGPLGDKTFGDTPFTLSATASSLLPVSFAVISGPATVSDDLVTLTGVGLVTIAAYQVGNQNHNAATNEQSFSVAKATPALSWSTPSDIPWGTALDTNQMNASAAIQGTFTYAPDFGTILNVGTNQPLSVSFVPDNTNDYNNATAQVSINVTKAKPVITWDNPADIIYGTALDEVVQLNASASVEGGFTYVPAAGVVLDAGSNQVLSASFLPDDGDHYETVAAAVLLNVLQATPTISWNNPADIVYGTALDTNQLNATASVPGTFNYSPAEGTVLNAGTNTLSVTFTPDNTNYVVVSANAVIVVAKADTSISWADPASIRYGTALGSVQLNATASVAGTFSYSPAVGTYLPAGTNELSVVFTPDSPNYNGTNATVNIIVTKAQLTIKADDKSKNVGEFNPVFTSTLTGFVAGDSEANLDVPISYSTSADETSPLGFYAIVPSGATSANYDITFVNGKLTVFPTSTIVSTATGGDWNVGSTWVGGVAPTAGDNVLITATSTVAVNSAGECFSIVVTNSTTSGGTLTVIAGSSLTVGGGLGPILVGGSLDSTDNHNTTTLSVAGTLNAGDVTMLARRGVRGVALASNKDAHAILEISAAAAIVNISGNITQNRNVTTGGLRNQVLFSAPGTLKIAGGFVSQGAGGTLVAGTGTVEYCNNGPQEIADFVYYNLILSGTGAKTGSVASSVGGTLVLAGEAYYEGSAPVYLAGSGLFYAGAVAQVVGSEFPATPPTPWNLSASNALGLTLNQSAQISGTLGLVDGFIDTATNTLTVDGTVVRSNGYVAGNLRKNFLVGANVAQTFEVGSSAGYNPVTLTMATVSGSGYVVVSARNGDHAAMAASKLDPAKSVNANWIVTPELPLAFDTCSANFNFDVAELDAAASASLLILGKLDNSTWTYPPVSQRTASSIEVSGLTSFSEFQLAENGAKETPVISWSNPTDIVYGTALSGTQLNAMADVPGTFDYNPTNGMVLNAGDGQFLSVTFTPDDPANYTTATTNVSINVAKAMPVITWGNPVEIFYGTALSGTQLNATADVDGSFDYDPTSGVVLNAGDSQVLSVKFTPADPNYATASASVNISVLKVTPEITVAPDASGITFGQALSSSILTGGAASVEGTFGFTSPSTVPGAAGDYSASVTFMPTDTTNCNAAGTTVVVSVARATPAITWSSPADIVYGTALDTNQLNATVSIPGTLVYTPSEGDILSAGTNQLSVAFTPDDLDNYTSTGANVSITVQKASLIAVADSFSRNVGEPNPEFTGTVTGIVNGDSVTVSYSCSADTNSAAATYPIVPLLSDTNGCLANYNVSITNGTLTVIGGGTPVAALLSIEMLPNQHPMITLQGGTNQNYHIEAVGQLGDFWQDIGNGTTDGNGSLQFEHTNALSTTQFYRAVIPK